VREGDEARIAAGTEAVDAVLVANPNLAEAGFVRAKVEIARQRYPEAIEALWRVVGARPGWAQAHYLLGTALLLSGEPAAARSEAVRSIELDAANPDAYRLLARSHARLGDHALAVKAAERALAAEPEDVATRVLVAESLVRERRFDEALGRLLAIPEAERGVDGNLALGRVYAFRQEYDNARRYLLLALEASPGQPAVLMDLALVDARQDRLDESVVRVRAARDAAPDDPALQELYGDVVWAAGDTAEAQRAFERALALDANRQSTYAKLGRLLVFTGRTDEAIATHQHALEQGEGAGGLHLVLATLLETRGRADEAMAHYESAIEANPELAVAKNNLAYLLAERGEDLDRALELARAALEALPENPSFADTLGWVLYKKNLPGAAIGYLQEAVGGMPPSDPSLPLVRQHLALAYEANENPEQAIEALEQAVRELDALVDPASGREPSWARDLRSQLERLREST
jgi:tetratricopeptide (TPR) repeat protein